MIEGYSFMDWVTFGGVLTTIASLVGIAIKLARDNSGLKAEMKALSKEREMEHDSLSSEHRNLSKEHDALSKEHASIKKDTEYISDEMKYEKMARENLYKNSTRAKEILETMDFMKEVVLQNSRLHDEVTRLTVANQEISKPKQNNELDKVLRILGRIEGQLASLEGYRSTEEVQVVLKRVESELSELSN
ncbi:MAG: hypothetical protein E7F48_10050 [Streptococcus oralis]|jgi:hypothetical protein|uniref:hypothetical protein n=1 Tax=Streptococcus mitis TaxID=28037 RepID=UPI000F908781|nr:hypothetical protein [Streptococcus mitis]MDU3460068.1 hypothetical protein [Streptococcus oralis]RSI78884.1 hypothetical protein D8852_09245 [Streptococcus mitis]